MADIGFDFDARTVDPARPSGDLLPEGWHNFVITASEMKQTQDKQGAYLELTLKVLDGPNANKVTKDRLNLYNNNPVAARIAQETLSAICHAVQVFQVRDASVLHNKPLMAKVAVRPERTDASGKKYGASNEIRGYAAPGSYPVTTATAAVPSSPAPAPSPVTASAPSGWGSVAAPPPAAAAPTPATQEAAPAPEQQDPNTAAEPTTRPPWLR